MISEVPAGGTRPDPAGLAHQCTNSLVILRCMVLGCPEYGHLQGLREREHSLHHVPSPSQSLAPKLKPFQLSDGIPDGTV